MYSSSIQVAFRVILVFAIILLGRIPRMGYRFVHRGYASIFFPFFFVSFLGEICRALQVPPKMMGAPLLP